MFGGFVCRPFSRVTDSRHRVRLPVEEAATKLSAYGGQWSKDSERQVPEARHNLALPEAEGERLGKWEISSSPVRTIEFRNSP